MKENEKFTPANLLDGFLDDTLSPKQRKIVEKAIEDEPELAAEVELQKRIDQSLQKMFAPPQAPTFDFAAIKAAAQADAAGENNAVVDPIAYASDPLTANERSRNLKDQTKPKSKTGVIKLLAAALAASLAWGIFGFQLLRDNAPEVAYQRRPLVEVYQDCVDGGFQPYWVCDNEKLFASTFEKRQGVALKLAEMPADTKMVGLSYLSGISRQSTSLLAEVDGQQVIVFVDRVGNDAELEKGELAEAGVNIFKTQKDGLVFYEVSPLAEAEVVNFLVKVVD